MRLSHVITRLMRGGADENTLLSCNAQAEAGHEVQLIYGADAAPEMVRRLNPKVHQVRLQNLVRPLHPIKDVASAIDLVFAFRRFRPDVVHTHTSKAGILGRAAAKAAGVRAIVHGVHILPFLNVGPVEKAIYLIAERALAPITDAFVNVSPGMQAAGLQHGVGRIAAHRVIPSGMDTDAFQRAAPIVDGELARALGVDPADLAGTKLIVMAAALEPRKRQFEFLEVFRRVARQVPDARLVLLGEGHDRQRLAARIEQMDLLQRVFMPGFRDDLQRWLPRAAVCVLASEREGLPRVVVQYALAARPIVSTDLPGVRAVVEHGETGFLAPLDHLEEMTEPLVAILTDPDLAGRLSAAAHELDLSAWSVEHMVAELEEVYRQVTSVRPSGNDPAGPAASGAPRRGAAA